MRKSDKGDFATTLRKGLGRPEVASRLQRDDRKQKVRNFVGATVQRFARTRGDGQAVTIFVPEVPRSVTN